MSTPTDEQTATLDELPELARDQLPDALRQGAARAGWSSLMPVQARAIPYLLAGREMMIQARTGSGKTGAFVLPMLERIDPEEARCQALVLVPTRELARQVTQVAETICSGTGLRTIAVYGGVGYGPQLDALASGAQIVVGTPGRVLDHLLRRTLVLDALRVRELQEAIPGTRWNASVQQAAGRWRLLGRVSYYAEWFDSRDLYVYHGDAVVDLEAAYPLGDSVTLTFGGQNVFGNDPEENPIAGEKGNRFSVYTPFGANGAFYYVRINYAWSSSM